ncbi:MAG: sulfite exporter TauE/SafE family protein [Syntrophobacteraceae bacterium]|nr:sulfite exporter TauE/SafE family protein [Syntrophobacteraceae bacterium]
MNRKIALFGAALGIGASMLFSAIAFAEPSAAPSPAALPGAAAATAAPAAGQVQISLDKTSLQNYGEVTVSGKAMAGAPVFVEVWSGRTVHADLFDTKKDKKTGIAPYILYQTEQMPAYYKVLVPADKKAVLETAKAEGKKWKFSETLKKCGALEAFNAPGTIPIQRYRVSLLGSVIGSRGTELAAMDAKENINRAMKLAKTRFRNPGALLAPVVMTRPDGSFTAKISVPSGAPDGTFHVRAFSGQGGFSRTLSFENHVGFPYVYLSNAGTSMNLLWPFLLSFAVCTFGVLMGAGGGFILNPLLVLIWPLPAAVVAGTVMPTVLFSQASGIFNYSKIKFISWKLGIAIGLAMLLGGFIGPELTELITLSQFKFIFGIILIFLACLMAWQTTPGYVAKNKKEKAILDQFQKKAKEAAAKKAQAKPVAV